MFIGTWMNAIGSIVRCFSVLPVFGVTGRFVILMFGKKWNRILFLKEKKWWFLGQFLCALAQTFILFLPTKFCFIWFSEKQRSLANSIAIGSMFIKEIYYKS
jgi:hypothetical protein